MKDLFMCLLLNIGRYGNITQASMYEDISNMELHTDNGDFSITVRKLIKKDEEKQNA